MGVGIPSIDGLAGTWLALKVFKLFYIHLSFYYNHLEGFFEQPPENIDRSPSSA